MGQHLFQHPWSYFFANLLPKNVCKFTRSVHDQLMYTFDWSTSILSMREITAHTFSYTLPTNSDVRNYIGNFVNSSHLLPNFNLDHYTSYFQRGPFLSPPLSFIHLMLCNYYIISVMIMFYYVTLLETQFIAIYDND